MGLFEDIFEDKECRTGCFVTLIFWAVVALVAFLYIYFQFLYIYFHEISLEEKAKLFETISSHRSDPELRKCEEIFSWSSSGSVTAGDFSEYNECISEIEKRRKEEEVQRKLDSLGIWKRGQDNE